MFITSFGCLNCPCAFEVEMELGSDVECPECGSLFATDWREFESVDAFSNLFTEYEIFLNGEIPLV